MSKTLTPNCSCCSARTTGFIEAPLADLLRKRLYTYCMYTNLHLLCRYVVHSRRQHSNLVAFASGFKPNHCVYNNGENPFEKVREMNRGVGKCFGSKSNYLLTGRRPDPLLKSICKSGNDNFVESSSTTNIARRREIFSNIKILRAIIRHS